MAHARTVAVTVGCRFGWIQTTTDTLQSCHSETYQIEEDREDFAEEIWLQVRLTEMEGSMRAEEVVRSCERKEHSTGRVNPTL